ncbi:hypothetical protein SLS56_005196 [Neofusicoccum ribis]|uniref:DUF6536 domain-containing protein n=1 Tax=Neofusicoccum ribis TaxID=45134 RepID=A0ABR3SV05_9PEZI
MSDSKSFQLASLKPSYSYTPVKPRDSVPSIETPRGSARSLPAGGFFDDSRSALVAPDERSETPSTGVVQRDASTRFPQGWRFGATFSATGAACVLLVNFTVAIWAYFKAGKRSDGYIYEGNCGKVDRVSTGVHLLINVLSTLLLGSSNYIQQCLSAPTRREVDLAHLKGIWLEIGQPSLRNLRFVPRWKLLMWILLALSSLPLHLFYNSTFYSSLAHNDYDYYFASGKFFEGAAFNTSEFPSPGTERYNNYNCYGEGNYTSCFPATYQTDPNSMQEDALRFDRLENEDCIRAYAQDFLAARRNLVLVVDDLDNTTSSLYSLRQYQVVPVGYGTPTPDPYYWICSNPSWYWKADYPVCSNALGSIEAHASNWTVYGYRIRYCQSESVDPKCRLNFNLPVLVIVIVFNAIKVVCICFVARRMRDQPMITLGDAVASFLRSPDAATKGMCLATRAHFQRSSKGPDWSQAIESPMTYKPQKMRWMRTASIRHWVATVFV